MKIYEFIDSKPNCIYDSKGEKVDIKAIPEDGKAWNEAKQKNRSLRLRTREYEVVIEGKEVSPFIVWLNVAGQKANIAS